jgi:prevent-host-death family protein
MRKTVDVDTMRDEIDRVLDDVAENGDPIVIDRDGRRVAAIVPIDVYDRLERERQRFFDQARGIAEQVNMDPDEADVLVDEAIAWARSQRSD